MLGRLSPADFLSHHWQKRPLLVRGGVPDLVPPLSPDELAGLACAEDVESRLVSGSVATRFTLEHGPFDEQRFAELPERDWTLLVQDVDKHVGGFERVLQPLRFLPDWRIDDVMISYATEGGSVGPHHDSYDVFLVQALGRRRWQWNPRFDDRLRSDCDLRVLAGFEPAEQAVVEPGDVLYLPPGVAHFGVALEPCLTLSIGFRAPDQHQLALAFADELTDRARSERRFCDPDRAPCPSPLELAATDRAELRRLLREVLDQSDRDLDAFLGRYLTQAKPHLEPTGDASADDAATLKRRLASGQKLQRRLGSRWLLSVGGEELSLFADGQCLATRPEDRPCIESLARGEPAGESLLSEAPGRGRLLLELLRVGALTWEQAGDNGEPD